MGGLLLPLLAAGRLEDQSAADPALQGLFDAWDKHHGAILWLYGLSAAASLGYLLRSWLVARSKRPAIKAEEIVYRESFASGNSHRNFFTRLGGASRCLRLVVTKDILWITSWFPFSLLAGVFDLEHVIPLHRLRPIERVERFGIQSLLVRYVDDRGREHALRLQPGNPAAFLRALRADAIMAAGEAVPVKDLPATPAPTLRQALKRYWHHLLGVGFFPTVTGIATQYLHVPFGVFIPVFFAVMIYGQWPRMTKRAPFGYDLVMGATWLGGGVLAVLVQLLLWALRPLFGVPPA